MLLKNANVFYQGAFNKINILIRNGLIVFADEYCDSDDTIDLEGRYLLPGLVDIHTHGCLGMDFTDAGADDLEKMCNYYAHNGVTSIIKTIMTAPQEKMLKAAAAPPPETGAHIQGLRFEGPFLNPGKRGAHDAGLLMKPDKRFLEKLINAASNKIIIMDIAPELNGASELIRDFSDSVRFSIAHTQCSYLQAINALKAGAFSFTHLFNAMEPIFGREPGPIGAFLDSSAYGECIGDLFHVHSANICMLFRSASSRLALISDSVAAGLPDGEYMLNGRRICVKNRKALCRNGTIAGSSANLFECMKNAVSIGIPFEQAAASCTEIPAEAAGISHFCGRILPGRPADMVVMTDSFKITHVFLNGRQI